MAVALLIIGAGGIGGAILRPLRFERALFAMLLGLIICAVWVIVAGSVSLPIAHAGVAAAAVLSILFLGWRAVRSRALPGLRSRVSAINVNPPLDWLERLSLAAVCLGLLFSFISALAPVTNWDAGAAHLALPSAYARAGEIGVFEANNYSAYPHLAHALYTLAYGAGFEQGVGLLSWIFAALGVGFTYCLGARLANRKAGVIGAAALAAAPIFADQAGTPSIDLVFACMVLAAVTALVAWWQEDEPMWLVLAGLLAGSACGVRHTGYLTAALLAVGVVLTAPKLRHRWALLFAAAVAMAAAPWLLRSALAVGNPFYPFFASMFGSWGAYDADVASLATHDSMRAWGVADFMRFPWSVVMAPDAFDGWSSNPGVLVLLLGALGVAFGGRRALLIGMFCLAGVLAMFFFRQHVRYLLPFFVPMMALAGVGAVRTPVARHAVAITASIALVFGLAVQAAAVHYKVPVALGLESRDAYLAKRIERYRAFEWAREHVPEDAVILSLDPRAYYFDRACYQNFEALKPLVGADPAARTAWLDSHAIDYLFYPDDYVRQSPGFRETGVQDVIDAWRSDASRFTLVASLNVERARGTGTELVEIYRVRRERGALAKRNGNE
jgi:hypothetical protein